MKLHRHLWVAQVSALRSIFEEGYHADKVIERHLKSQPKWGSRDRKSFAESVYEGVRWWRLNWSLLGHEMPPQGIEIPEEALWHFLAADYIRRGGTLEDGSAALQWEPLKSFNVTKVKKQLRDPNRPPAVEYSFPDTLWNRLSEELGPEKWQRLAVDLNQQAPVDLRANMLKEGRAEVLARLLAEGVECEPLPNPEGLRLKERKNVFITETFRNGFFEVQDYGSQTIAPFLRIEPGNVVVDACAGAGGKTLHLAALLQNKGKVIALDVHDKKLHQNKLRCRRAGVSTVEHRLIDSAKVYKRLFDRADRLLLDVPCSGVGVLRRNPDTKWKFEISQLEKLHALQRDILDRYSPMVKVDGFMLYATCSILPSENQDQITAFLERNSEFELLQQWSLRPDLTDSDGFYAALLKRTTKATVTPDSL